MIGREGQVKLVDFGIARNPSCEGLTRPGTALGTPPYISPEQLAGERGDGPSDLFALGVLMYEMLTGQVPYPVPEDDEWASLSASMKKERYTRLRRRLPDDDGVRGSRVPSELRRAVHSCLRAKPARRPISARVLAQRLGSLAGASADHAREEIASWAWESGVFQRREAETLVIARPRSERRAHGLGWAMAAGIAALALAGGWWLTTGWVASWAVVLAQVPD